jgi:hypothetical protein
MTSTLLEAPMARSRAAQVASPTIAQVLATFLADEQRRLAPRTFEQYESVVELFQHSLNGYAYQSLGESDAKLFDRFYNANGDAHREFCDIFGPEHILPNVNEFLRHFMVRKVIAGRDLLRVAGTMTKRLALWLAEKGYATAGEAEDAAERGTSAARNLPKADQLASLLHDFAESQYEGDERTGILDHFTVTRVERGKVWLEGTDGREFGPIAVPQEISSRCNVGWMISGMLAGRGRKWRLVEAGNVYPN